MESGKIPEAILKRTVLNKLSFRNSESLEQRPEVGVDASCFHLPQNRLLTACAMRQGKDCWLGAGAVHTAVNNIYAAIGNPVAVTAVVTFPTSVQEADLRAWLCMIQQTCDDLEIFLAAGHTAVSEAVSEPIVAITAFGYPIPWMEISRNNQTKWAGSTILMTESAGKEGTARLANFYWEELSKWLPISFLNRAVNFSRQLSVKKEANCLFSLLEKKELDPIACHDCSEGGIFGAMWEFGEALDCGMSLDLTKISFQQETIEICEYLDKNPYQLLCGGSLLIATKQPIQVTRALEMEGISVSILGTLNETKDKILFRGEEKRYLEPYRKEELFQRKKIREQGTER